MMGEITNKNWKETDLNVDSLWIINQRDKSGKHQNVYHGNFIPQIPNQLIRRYTKEGETVLELFSGGGTTLYECENLNRNYIGFDINKDINSDVIKKMNGCDRIKYEIYDIDVTNREAFKNAVVESLNSYKEKMVDFMIAHPPYLDIIKFTNDKRDLSRISDLKIFLDKFVTAIDNSISFLKKDKYFAIVAGDIYRNSEVIPLAFRMMDAVKHNFNVKLKGIIIKNIEGNKGKLGSQNIWRYRALQSDYYIFKHEYIFVFKKIN